MPAAAVLGSAVIGAYSSNKASKTAADSAKKGLAQSAALADQSRQYALDLYDRGSKSARQGLTSAFNFYRNNAAARYKPFIQANTAAQGLIQQGAQQAQNAIYGLPVNLAAIQPQQVNPDLSFIQNAQLPTQNPQIGPEQASQVVGGLMSGVRY